MHFTKSTCTVSLLTLAIGLAINGYSQSFLTNGIVAYYPFYGNANDASVNGNNGTVNGSTLTTDRFGYTNQAYLFNGTTAYIIVPNAPANNVAAQFTISFWMNPTPGYGTPANNNIQIISKWGGGGAGLASYQIGVTGIGQLYVATSDGTQTTQATDTSVTTTGVWHQIILVRDGTGFHLYRDNILLFSTNSLAQPQPSVLNLNFGREETGNYAYYGGGLDDIRIYNRGLSPSEVQGLYEYESSSLNSGLVAYYPFSGNANDASGNGNDGTPIGVALTPDRFGNPTNAYQFNGTATSYIQVGDRPLLRMTNALTISAWVYETATTNAQMIVSKEGEYWLGTWRSVPSDPSSFKLYVALETGVSPDVILLGNPPPLSKWTQVAVTFNSGNVAAYVNGNLITNLTTGSTIVDTEPSMNDFRIGNRQLVQLGWNVEPFVGNIDDVRVYNRALSASEVQQLYVIESGPRVDFVKAFTLDYANLTLGSNYVLQASADMLAWTNWGSPFTATSVNYSNTTYQRIDDWGKLFFRLQVAP